MCQISCKNPINTVYLFKNIASFTISIPIRIVPKIKRVLPRMDKSTVLKCQTVVKLQCFQLAILENRKCKKTKEINKRSMQFSSNTFLLS